ncbi:hypothetical protein FGRMN_601 [Fusarium graminum]|nr:hypothetical protein FGRMN_601 [Fusarium graminum]
MNFLNPFSRKGAQWAFVGLASSFPDVDDDAGNLAKYRLCSTKSIPGCKAFHVPKEDSSLSKEVPIGDDALGQELTDQVLIFKYKGKFHAIDHSCPHSQFPLSRGTPFDIEDFGVTLSVGVSCPKHDWSFDLFTGMSDRGSYKLKTWEVQIRDSKETPPSETNEKGDGMADREVWGPCNEPVTIHTIELQAASQQRSQERLYKSWIAPLPEELAAAKALLDDRHDTPDDFYQPLSDNNSYTWGRMGKHNLVIVSLPAGKKDIVSAAVTVSNLASSLSHIRIGLLVGIGGAIPRPDLGRDIRLGDVVVSRPHGRTGGVIQYDQGRVTSGQTWEPRGYLNMPPPVLLNALADLHSEHLSGNAKTPTILQRMWENKPNMTRAGFVHQGTHNDKLFRRDYSHIDGDDCGQCDEVSRVTRVHRSSTDPIVHYGVIASGNAVVKDAITRDRIVEAIGEECLCLETEAAGLMNHFPCLVVRGISDYADSHKNDRWQKYAAIAAAALAKELLESVPVKRLFITPTVREHLEKISHDLRYLRSDAGDVRMRIQNMQETLLTSYQKELIDRLPIALDASYDSASESENPRCLPDTRTQLLEDIMHWVQNKDAQPIFWLNGMAGTGKSTVSRTFAEHLKNDNSLGATFFFKRAQGDRGNAKKLFTTIASQLATSTPSIAPSILEAINADINIGEKGLKQQFENLILKPLSSIASSAQTPVSLVLVIDALDECELEHAQAKRMLEFLETARDHLKIFITSRPELPIRLGFFNISGKYEHIILHNIAEPIIRHDLSVFFEHQLGEIRSDYNATVSESGRLLSDWPGINIQRDLVERASPLFIYAATVCRFIGDSRCGDPKQQMETILDYQRTTHTSQLKATYLPVLTNLVKGLYGNRREIVLKRFKLIVGTIISLASPLSIKSLANLLSIFVDIVEDLLRKLHSVLHIPEAANRSVKLLHLSFRDLLLDYYEIGQEGFHVNELWICGNIFHQCLKVMEQFLRVDICDLRGKKMESSTISKNSIDAYIPQEIQYACLHWLSHFEKNLPTYDYEPITFLHDPSRFLRANITTISSAPLQIYYSALLFTPQTSQIRKALGSETPNFISRRPQTSPEWSNIIQRFKYDQSKVVKEVLFSPDSSIIASSYDDTSVDIWRPSTGDHLHELKTRSPGAISMSFSPDSKLLTTSVASEGAVFVWRIEDGGCVKELGSIPAANVWACFDDKSDLLVGVSVCKGSTTCFRYEFEKDFEQFAVIREFEWESISLAFSRNSTLVASIAKTDDCILNRDIHLWNIRCETDIVLRLRSEERCGLVHCFKFSSDSSLLTLNMPNLSVVWETANGYRTDLASEDAILFSPLSRLGKYKQYPCIHRQIREGYDNRTLKPGFDHYDEESTEVLESCLYLGQMRKSANDEKSALGKYVSTSWPVVLSSDSKFVAVSNEAKIFIFRADTGAAIKFESPVPRGNRPLFSDNSEYLAASTCKGDVCVWSLRTGKHILNFVDGHDHSMFSPDSTMLLTRRRGTKSVRLWLLPTGECYQILRCLAVAFTANSKQLASFCRHGKISLWSIENREIICTWNAFASGSPCNNSCVSSPSDEGSFWTFSHDTQYLATNWTKGADKRTIRVLRTRTDQIIARFDVSLAPTQLSFEPGTLKLLTGKATFVLDELLKGQDRPAGYLFNEDLEWITYNGRRLIWLPREYRPFAARGGEWRDQPPLVRHQFIHAWVYLSNREIAGDQI